MLATVHVSPNRDSNGPARSRERPLSVIVAAAAEGGGFSPPSLADFYPPAILFAGTPFEINRIMSIRLLMTGLLIGFFFLALRNPRVVPRGLQNAGEIALDFVRVQIAEEILGKVNGRRFLPIIASIFFMVLVMNITGVIPLLNISSNAVIGAPLVLAVLAYVAFNYAGIKQKGLGGYLKSSTIVPGLPVALHFMVAPIEFVSTFILRPVTLTIRLLANMLAGHILLVLFFSATSFFLFESSALLKVVGPFTLLVGFAFTLFEILVAFLQAYIFALLTAVYLDLAMAEEH